MPTIKDVAREAGVSIATVSYVINKKDNGISEDTRRNVLEAIRRVGYTPNITARNLRASRTRLIGYAWHRVQPGQVNSVLDYFIYYLAQAAEQAGYHILTFTHNEDNVVDAYDELIRTGRIDAFVLSDTVADDPRIAMLMARDFPFVAFGRSNPDWDFAWIDTDGSYGTYEATRYLIELGHRRIAMAAWPEGSISGEDRVNGYLGALDEAGIALHPAYIQRGPHDEQSGRNALVAWWDLPQDERPTAIVSVTDLMAIGVMNEAERLGLIIGEDLSVVGYDDAPLVQYLRPALSSVRQPITEIGQEIVRMLEERLDTDQVSTSMLRPRLIKRASCGPPPAGR